MRDMVKVSAVIAREGGRSSNHRDDVLAKRHWSTIGDREYWMPRFRGAWQSACLERSYAAPLISPPPGGGTGTPSETYSLSLLRKVRIEMPRILAAWVRLPRQCFSVSRIRSRSTSATVRPTSDRVTCSAAIAACATAGG